MKRVLALAALAVASLSVSAQATVVTWDSFEIRSSTAPSPVGVDPVYASSGNNVTASIVYSGQKVGFGTSAYNGLTLGSLLSVDYTRVDAGTNDPYLNIWVNDGPGGHSAVIAPVANMNNAGNYTSNNIDHLSLGSLGFNIYETNFSDLSWLGVANPTRTLSALTSNGQFVTLSQIASLLVGDPGSYSAFVGTGAPKHGTGVNLIFGDTQGNFTSPVPYSLADVTVSANAVTPVPTPAAAWGGLALMGLFLARRATRTTAA